MEGRGAEITPCRGSRVTGGPVQGPKPVPGSKETPVRKPALGQASCSDTQRGAERMFPDADEVLRQKSRAE